MKKINKKLPKKITESKIFIILCLGLKTGASDNDPSGITTYS